MEFELFSPSEKILEAICTDNNLVTQYTIFPPQSREALEKMISSTVVGLINQVAEYYLWALDIDKNMNAQKLAHAFGEALSSPCASSFFEDTDFQRGRRSAYAFEMEWSQCRADSAGLESNRPER